MQRQIKTTKDGSKTLYINDLHESYHSSHGALQEAQHVFIINGLNLINKCEINILELGFGTGLNVLVTIDEFLRTDKYQHINYYTLEKYPVKSTEIEALDYPLLFQNKKLTEIYQNIHEVSWEKTHQIIPGFSLTKFQCDFYSLPNLEIPHADLVYFDCFGARVQPDLWEEPFLKLVTAKMAKGSLLTTYSSKGSTRRALEALGLTVTKKPGPPGKREMMNALKN